MDIWSYVIYGILFLVFTSSLGATLIGLPGNWVILVVLLCFSFFTKFAVLTLTETIVLAGILLLGEIIESSLALLNANRYKPSKWTLLAAFCGGIVGALIGTSILPIVGSIIGSAAGVFGLSYFVELRLSANKAHAEQVAKSAMIGALLGVTIKFILAVGVVMYLFWTLIITYTAIPAVGVPF